MLGVLRIEDRGGHLVPASHFIVRSDDLPLQLAVRSSSDRELEQLRTTLSVRSPSPPLAPLASRTLRLGDEGRGGELVAPALSQSAYGRASIALTRSICRARCLIRT